MTVTLKDPERLAAHSDFMDAVYIAMTLGSMGMLPDGSHYFNADRIAAWSRESAKEWTVMCNEVSPHHRIPDYHPWIREWTIARVAAYRLEGEGNAS